MMMHEDDTVHLLHYDDYETLISSLHIRVSDVVDDFLLNKYPHETSSRLK